MKQEQRRVIALANAIRLGGNQCECGVESVFRDHTLIERLPDRVPLETLHPIHAGFRAPPSFDVALKKLQGVAAIDIEPRVADSHGRFDLAAQRD